VPFSGTLKNVICNFQSPQLGSQNIAGKFLSFTGIAILTTVGAKFTPKMKHSMRHVHFYKVSMQLSD
jgi:hypothetical protein